MTKCLACGGVYSDTTADGLRYFHACPPLSAVELAAAVTAGKVALPIDPLTGLPETVSVALSRRTYERATKRDENVTPTGAPIKIGAGTAPAAAPAPTVVIV